MLPPPLQARRHNRRLRCVAFTDAAALVDSNKALATHRASLKPARTQVLSFIKLIARVFTGKGQTADAHSRAGAPAARYWITNPYHAVSIVPAPPQACQEVKALIRRRFLSTDAPALPLLGCSLRACLCVYKHHDDRRITQRRAADRGGAGRIGNAGERRRTAGRRSEDSLRAD